MEQIGNNMTTESKSVDQGLDDGLADLGELDFDFVTTDGQENVWCDQCKSLKQELQRLQEEHTLNYNTLKKKIISTDLLIKKYKAKCEDHDSQTKKLEEMGKKLEISQRESETLRVQLGSALQQIEPIKKAKQAIEADNNLKRIEIQTLEDKLTAAVTVKKQYENLAKDSSEYKEKYEDLKKSHTKRIKELESSYSKQEIQLLKYKDECHNLKSEQTLNTKKQRKLESRLRKTVGRIDRYWMILKENGLLPKGEKKLRTEHYLSQSHNESPLDESNDCLPLLEKEFRYSDNDNEDEEANDIDDIMMSWTFSPVVHALSPLPPSPLTIRRMHSQDKADSDVEEDDNDKDEEFAKQLENEFLAPSETPSNVSLESSSVRQGRQLTRQAATTGDRATVKLADTAVLNTSKGFSISDPEEVGNEEVDENIPQIDDNSDENVLTNHQEVLDVDSNFKIQDKESEVVVKHTTGKYHPTSDVGGKTDVDIDMKDSTVEEKPKLLDTSEKILINSSEISSKNSNICSSEIVAEAEEDLKNTPNKNAQKSQPNDFQKTAEENVSISADFDLANNDSVVTDIDNSSNSPSPTKTRLSRSISMPLRTSPRSNNLKNRIRRSTCGEINVSNVLNKTQPLKTSGEVNKSAKCFSADNIVKDASPIRVTRSTTKLISPDESSSGVAVRSNTRTRMPTSRQRKTSEKDHQNVKDTTKDDDTKQNSTQCSSATESETEEREVSAIWSPRRFTRAMSRQVSTGFMSKASSDTESVSPTSQSSKSEKSDISSAEQVSKKTNYVGFVSAGFQNSNSESQGLSCDGKVSEASAGSAASELSELESSESHKQVLPCVGKGSGKPCSSGSVTAGLGISKSEKQEFSSVGKVFRKPVLKGFVSGGFECFRQEPSSQDNSSIKSQIGCKIEDETVSVEEKNLNPCRQNRNEDRVSSVIDNSKESSKTSNSEMSEMNHSSAKTNSVTHSVADLKPSKAVLKLNYDRVNEKCVEIKKNAAQKTIKPVKSSQLLSKQNLSLPISSAYKESSGFLQQNIASSTVDSPSVIPSNKGQVSMKSPSTPTTNSAVLSASSPVSPLPPSPYDFFIPIAISPLPPSPARDYESPLSPLPSSPWEMGDNDDSGDSTPRAMDQCNLTDSSGDITPVQTPILFLTDQVPPEKDKSPIVLTESDRMSGNPCSFHAEVPAGVIKPKISKPTVASPIDDTKEDPVLISQLGTLSTTKRKSTEKQEEPLDKKICMETGPSKETATSQRPQSSVPLWKVIDEDMKDFMSKSVNVDAATKEMVVKDMVQLLLDRDHGCSQGSVLPVLLQWIVQCLRCNQVESLTVLQPCLEDEKQKTKTKAHVPLLTKQEESLLHLIVSVSSHWDSMQQKLLESLWNAVFLTDVIPTAGVTSLCIDVVFQTLVSDTTQRIYRTRMLTALCSIKGDVEQVHVLYYNVLTRCNLPCTFLASAIAGVWPASLLKKESGEQPILTVIEHIVTQQLSPGKPVCEKILLCLEKLCNWSRITLNSRTILRQQLKFLEDESRQTSPRKHLMFEAEKAVELLIHKEPVEFYKMSFIQCGLNQTSQRFASDNWVKKDATERMNTEYVKAIVRLTAFGILRKNNITTKYVNTLVKKHLQKILDTRHASMDVQICVIEMLIEISFLTPGNILFLLRTWFNSHRSHVPPHLCQRLCWTRETLVKKFPGLHCDPFT